MQSDSAHDHHDHPAHARHGHSHAAADFGLAFAIGIALNLAFVVVEAAYGLRGSSILAALANAVLLLIAVGAIAVEAVQRFGNPQLVAGTTVMVVACIVIAINSVTALLFATGRKGDLNIRGAYLHMAADAAVSMGVVLSGLLISLTAWNWFDPVTSLVIAAVIVASTGGLLRDAVLMSLDPVPPGIDRDAVCEHLSGLPGVTQVHDLHIWPMSTTEIALTAHLVRPDAAVDDACLHDAANTLQQRFDIGHSTLQVECGNGHCALAPDEVV